MKHFFALALIFPSLLFISCKSTPTDTPDTTSKGTPTAVGTPVGTPTSATIDAAGGTLTSPDGRLEIVIPANALSAATEISIQPVTNEAPLGAGLSFSLTPHGQQFSKPITLRFHYTADDLLGSDEWSLAVATQKDDRIWYAYDTKTLDLIGETISVQASSFSVKTLYQSLKISPTEATIKVNESQPVTVMLISPIPADNDPNDDLSALGSAIPYPNPEEISWTLNGSTLGSTEDGYLIAVGNTATATYKAPSTTENMTSNPVAVTAEIDFIGGAKHYLISNIKVSGAEDTIRRYKVTVDFKGPDMWGMDFKYGYEDQGSFIATLYPGEDSARISSIDNSEGKITRWTETNPNCTHKANGAGNYLNIVNAKCLVMLYAIGANRFFPSVESKGLGFALTTECGGVVKTTPPGTSTSTYSAAPFLLDGTTQSIDDVTTSTAHGGALVTFTVTPL